MEVAMEYLHPEDDAWYDVSLTCDGEMLTLKYADLSDIHDETIHVESFKSTKELEDFKGRFRLSSVQLQDKECGKIVQGETICASCKFPNGEVKFYNAIVVEVLNKDHEFVDGEEQCFCRYVLKWQHGSLKGVRTFANISDICLVPPGKQIDLSLAFFLDMARESIECHDEAGTSSNKTFDVLAFLLKLRRRRKFRYATRTIEGGVHGHCKKIIQAMDEDL